jgi:hypothetical protein
MMQAKEEYGSKEAKSMMLMALVKNMATFYKDSQWMMYNANRSNYKKQVLRKNVPMQLYQM